MPTTIRTDDVREILALIPFQLGFRPAESAVLVSLRGARSTVGLVARADLADLATDEEARRIVGHLLADGARRALVVIYTEADLQSPAATTGARSRRAAEERARAAARALTGAATQAFDSFEVWVIGERGYYALGCTDLECCPPGGRPVEDLQGTRVCAQMVLEGVLVAPSRQALVRLPVVTAAQRKSARRAADRWRARGAAADPGAPVHRWRRDGLAIWREALHGVLLARPEAATVGPGGRAVPAVPAGTILLGAGAPGVLAPTRTGRLLAALDDVLVRDAVLLSFVEGNERIEDRLVAGDTGPAIGDALATITDPELGRRPDPVRSAAARSVLEHAAAHAARGLHAPSLTLLAVLAWWEGDGARAGVLVDRALLAEPGYRLAHLVDQALRSGMPPGWVRGECAS